ncbi:MULTISPECIES: 3-dehydroquinate synthase [unclassified Lentimicrobium]|uniref:3-dehydroquinate synthase n=1 Tax=unclassified Lentimicrobium TaxID=2677434 RepID=UPI001551B074|nr:MULTISPECIES: 3-dehydroquinate synthase [unclassified Lentimicrobium]NPD44422.1 3-dehydroquinate synthase [Lentimicrobium sp. S6]NPD84312.1 3-dehydroquinate synthase [Lentimicrobium sp. L6]
MKETKIVTQNYPIYICESAGEQLDSYISKNEYCKIFILMDENIMDHCWPILQHESEEIKKAEVLVIEAGESSKDIEIAAQLWHALGEYEADRSSLLVNFGGGMISDLGGFIASTFKRGMDFVNIPTSLLSMVDASIGGKTAVNLGHFKNQVGLFSEPKSLFIQYSFLNTLDDRQILSGWAEMLKHGLITDKKHWEALTQVKDLKVDTILGFIENSIQIKKEVVEQDFTEKNIRKTLNFGHTLGHALESYSMKNDKIPLLHGEAVAIGMILESYLSVKKGLLSQDEFSIIRNEISSYYNPYEITEDFIEQVETLLWQDKKKSGNELNLTFVSSIGESIINQNSSLEDIKESIKFYKAN